MSSQILQVYINNLSSVSFPIGLLILNFFDVVVFLVIGILIGAFSAILIKSAKDKKSSLEDNLELVILQVKVPREVMNEEEKKADLKTMEASVELFYANLWSIFKKKNGLFRIGKVRQPVISLEMTSYKEQINFFVVTNRKHRNFVERQIHSVWSDAELSEVKTDHTIFNSDGVIECKELKLEKEALLPIKTYKTIEYDTLNSITTSISKMKEKEEAAMIQIILKPAENEWRDKARSRIKELRKGEEEKKSLLSKAAGAAGSLISDFIFYGISGSSEKQEQAKKEKEQEEKAERRQLTPLEEEKIKAIGEKAQKLGFNTLIRIVVSSKEKEISKSRLDAVVGVFTQFGHQELNKFTTRRSTSPKLMADIVMRNFPDNVQSILNTEELATIFHLPNKYTTTPDIQWLPSKKSQAPPNLPTEGTLLGVATFRGVEKEVRIKPEDRFRHMYVIGQTGVGKSYFLKQMIVSDILNGHGVTYLDPHGEDCEDILKYIPKERAEDVIYFDPGDTSMPMGLNIMEAKTEEEKDLMTQEFISILYKLFDAETMGPIFEHSVRNAMMGLMDDDSAVRTLVEMPRIFVDEKFADYIGKKAKNFLVRDFFEKEMKQTSANAKGERLSYIIAKFGRFITAPMMRNIIGQSKSTFDFSEVMATGKILLCNLSKGKLGVFNSQLLGMIIVSKLKAAAMARANIPIEQRRPMFLYVDEFQNFANESFTEILSEARKYRLSLIMAHQFVKQLPDTVKSAVLGNVGTVSVFRVGIEDAEDIAKLFPNVFNPTDVSKLPNYNCYVRLMVDGQNGEPFSMQTIKIKAKSDPELGEAIKNLSKLKYSRPKDFVEMEIEERMKISE